MNLIPKHVAVIMDGNGRWAKARGLPRVAGHKKGAEIARNIVKWASASDVEYLTLFSFSAENWSRPESEVSELMNLLRHYLKSEMAELHKNNARLKVIGSRVELDKDIVDLIQNAENLTQDNTGICVVIALNYGSRQEILAAAKMAAQQALSAGHLDDFDQAFSDHLMTVDIPDPDLVIRTSNEQRISNFLLWQSAYSEFVFTETLWPDFSEKDFKNALLAYAGRERRYGGISDQGDAQDEERHV